MLFINLFLKKKYLLNRMDFIKFMKENLKYSDDWFTNNIHIWCHIFEKKNFLDKDINILEIGSYEGISACFFLRYLPNSNIDCVETFEGSEEHSKKDFNKVYLNFNHNLDQFNERYKVYKMSSNIFFEKKKNENLNKKNYDIIYIDGSHKYDDVLNDAKNSLLYLKEDGVIIFDDFLRSYYKDIKKNPIKAVIEFLNINKKKVTIMLINYQIFVKKKLIK